MISKKYIAFFFFIGLTSVAFSQEKEREAKKNSIIEQRIELIAELTGGEDIDFTTLFDELSNYYDHPIDLNNTNREELQELLLLTDIQINNLFVHIEKYGRLISIYELQSITGWDLQTIQNILPFVQVADHFDAAQFSLREMMRNGQHEWINRITRSIEQQEGFLPITDSALAESPNSRYLGDANKLYSRYRFRFGNFVSWGITGEKDAGEQFFNGTQKNGFDFYSAHLFLRNIRSFKAIAIGDYQVAFGQGLTFATGLAFGKSSNTLGIKRNQMALRPYTSADENLFMRGAATTFSSGKFEITGFFSKNKVDGNSTAVSDTSTTIDDEIVVSSFQTSGLHSTPAELEDRKIISVMHTGGHVQFRHKRLQIGATTVYSGFGGELNRDLGLYNQFEFEGTHNLVMGIDYSYLYKNFNFFGETSRSLNGGMATVNGIILSLDPKLAVSFLYRNYARNYQSLFANAIGESSRPFNESGIYSGIEIKPNAVWSINAYFDLFQSNCLRYQLVGLSRGHEYLAQLTWKPSKKVDGYFRIRHREKMINSSYDTDEIDFPLPYTQTNYRFHINYKVTEAVTFKNRVELIDYKENTLSVKKGYLIYQDVIFKMLSSPVSVTFRYAIFDTEDFDARIYAYENDVLYAFSTPAYYYRGSRMYGIIRYQYKKMVDVWIRYGQWLYNNRDEIGSGLNTVTGNRRSDIKVQLIWKF